MIVDLTQTAGFPLWLDTQNLEVRTSSILRFKRSARKAGQLLPVLNSPGNADIEREMYYTFYLDDADPLAKSRLDSLDLTYSLVLIPPGKIGREFVKTTGHYHPFMPDSSIPYPEIYLQLYGHLILAMQKASDFDNTQLEVFRLVQMSPGMAVNMPPGFGHALINHTDQPALMAGLYSTRFAPDYEPIKQSGGMGYFVLDGPDGKELVPNPNYTSLPEPQILADLHGTPFESPYPGMPVWSAFMNDPQGYSFLSNPESASEYYQQAGLVLRNREST